MCEAMLKHSAGHTAAIHTNDQALVREYGQRMHACRIIWNSPSSLGEMCIRDRCWSEISGIAKKYQKQLCIKDFLPLFCVENIFINKKLRR